jgi:hypothetical protein
MGDRLTTSIGLAAAFAALTAIALLAGFSATSASDSVSGSAAMTPAQAVERAFSVVEEAELEILPRPEPTTRSDSLVIQGQAVERSASRLPDGRMLEQPDDGAEIRAAVSTFVWALSNGAAQPLWALAPEMTQDRFGSQEAVLAYFAQSHPPLRYAERMSFERISVEGGLPVASIYVRDRLGMQWRASFTLFRDSFGHWKIIDSELEPAPGELV